MRNIKFRAFDNENKEMLEVENLYFNDISNKVEIKTTIYSDYFNENEMILMQYTGLKDKNGKEIYEGDIVQEVYKLYKCEGERRGRKYVVKFDEDRCGYTPFACGDGCGCCESEVISVENAEVIGNIYDNPELLEIQN